MTKSKPSATTNPKAMEPRETGVTSSSPLPPPWHTHLTLDTLLLVLSRTLFHPFPAFILPLSLRALATPLTHPSFIITSLYFLLVLGLHLGSYVSHRVAYGPPRTVDLEEDEVVVITGGARGLGLCVAEIYGMRGANVAVLDREVEEGEREGIRFYKCDVGNQKEVESIWKTVVKELGTPTILINNAAVVHGKRFLSLTYDEIETTFRTNTLSHYHLTSLFLLPLLSRPSGGTLVTVSSVLAHLGASNLSAYTASKAALPAFHASLTAELASSPHSHIRTILVTPGQLATGLFANIRLGPVARFFAPVVEVRELALRLVNMINAGEGGVLALPAYAGWIAWFGILPLGVQSRLRDWSGLDGAVGRAEGGAKGGWGE